MYRCVYSWRWWKNDLLRRLLIGKVKQYTFTIYSRWGQVIFQTSQAGKGGNGRVAGTSQESSVFVWTCTYRFEGGKLKNGKETRVAIR